MEHFFLLVAARRVADCLLKPSYTARCHPGMKTRSSASPSDVASVGRARNFQRMIEPMNSIASRAPRGDTIARMRKRKTVPNFKTLTGEVRRGLKVGTFFFFVDARRVYFAVEENYLEKRRAPP